MDRATSLLKALDLLTVIGGDSKGFTVQELAALMNMPRTTVIRVLNTVHEYGFVEREGRLYRMSPSFHEWASPQRHRGLKRRYRPILNDLATATGELVLLGTLEGAGVVHLDFIEADHAVRVAPAPMTHHNIRRNAIGKLILSQRPDLAEPWLRDDPEFAGELEKVRETGVAWNFEESVQGMIAVAVNGLRPVHSEPKLAIAWPVARFSERKAKAVLNRVGEIVAEAVAEAAAGAGEKGMGSRGA